MIWRSGERGAGARDGRKEAQEGRKKRVVDGGTKSPALLGLWASHEMVHGLRRPLHALGCVCLNESEHVAALCFEKQTVIALWKVCVEHLFHG